MRKCLFCNYPIRNDNNYCDGVCRKQFESLSKGKSMKAIIILVLATTGCTSIIGDYKTLDQAVCDRAAECNNANENECLANMKASGKVAADANCSDQFQALEECMLNSNCGDNNACSAKVKALNDCTAP